MCLFYFSFCLVALSLFTFQPSPFSGFDKNDVDNKSVTFFFLEFFVFSGVR